MMSCWSTARPSTRLAKLGYQANSGRGKRNPPQEGSCAGDAGETAREVTCGAVRAENSWGRGRAPENLGRKKRPGSMPGRRSSGACSRRGAFLLGLLLWLEAVEKIGGALRECGCGKDRAFVFLQN